ncbi:MAG: SDR family oxidoreductase [Firmicutes bacterium]|nr:SDR family oxidoreductase [Bacillota bacterium]
MKLKDKVVVITGSTRGIGKAIAKACAKEGAKIVISSRTESAVKQQCDILRRQGLSVSCIAADVTKKGDIEKLFKHAIETWGRIDVWINNAGMSGGFRPLDELSEEEIESIIDTNLTAVLHACRLVIPYFNHKGGVLINLTGKGGRGDASPYMAAYAATKAAITNLTKSLARENAAYPISIHAVSPGMVDTDLIKNSKRSPMLAEHAESIPYVLKAIGMPVDEAGKAFVDIVAQEPGKETGNIYSLVRGLRLMKGIALLMWYRRTGKIKEM